LPLLRKRGPDRVKKILNMSSLLGSIELADFPEGAAYRIAKCGLNMLTKLQSIQLAKENFIVYSSHPGLVKTDMSVGISKIFPELVINPDESISKQLAKLDSATAADSGKFIDYEGQVLKY
jgi:NAD(P)-dependent dehydrogenase (short-subunit alcohol dehydrogenase family)